MSALPKAVRDQVKLADKIVAEVYGEDGKIKEPEQPKVDDTPAPEPEKKPEAAPKVDDKPADPAPQQVDWEHKFKVLQGKYNAEVPRLQKQLASAETDTRETAQRIANLEGMIATLQAVKADPPPPPTPAVSDEEREQFGDDLIDLIKRVSLNATLPEIESHLKPLEGRVKQVDEKVAHSEQTVAESKRQQVFDRLAAAVPNWDKQNENPEFLEWLDQEEGMSGKPRAYFLTEAMKLNNADVVIRYFTGFQSENTADDPPEPTPVTDPTPEPQVKLEDLSAPGTPQTGTASAPNESGKRVWTRADIARFYADRNQFVKKGKPIPKELQKLERDIFAAQSEGRVR